jgi:hypothetical protein
MPHCVRPPASVVRDYAGSLNAWAGSKEPVGLHLKQKAGNPDHRRPIMSFGLENRALQLLALRALRAQAALHANQYAMRGVHAAIRTITDLLKDGFNWAIESDIANCYGSFDGEKVPELLPLPEEVTRRVLTGASLSLRLLSGMFGPADPGEDDEVTFSELFATARRGFPQGSAASPLAVEMLLAPLFEHLPAGGSSVGYADNFLAMGKNESDAVSMTSSFWSALKAHPAGHLGPKEPRIFAAGDPIEFLGHRIHLQMGAVRIDPSPENSWEFERRLRRSLKELKKTPKALRAKKAAALTGYVRSWTGAFSQCTEIKSLQAAELERIDAAKAWKPKLCIICKPGSAHPA